MKTPEFLEQINADVDPSDQEVLRPKLVNWQVLNVFLRDSKPVKWQVGILILLELNGANRTQMIDKLISRYNKLNAMEIRRQLAMANE